MIIKDEWYSITYVLRRCFILAAPDTDQSQDDGDAFPSYRESELEFMLGKIYSTSLSRYTPQYSVTRVMGEEL